MLSSLIVQNTKNGVHFTLTLSGALFTFASKLMILRIAFVFFSWALCQTNPNPMLSSSSFIFSLTSEFRTCSPTFLKTHLQGGHIQTRILKNLIQNLLQLNILVISGSPIYLYLHNLGKTISFKSLVSYFRFLIFKTILNGLNDFFFGRNFHISAVRPPKIVALLFLTLIRLSVIASCVKPLCNSLIHAGPHIWNSNNPTEQSTKVV